MQYAELADAVWFQMVNKGLNVVADVMLKASLLKVCDPVNVCPASVRAIVAFVDGNVIVVLSVPASVNVLFAVKVLPLAIVSVDPDAGAVIATLLMLVALATPRVGVTSVGLSLMNVLSCAAVVFTGPTPAVCTFGTISVADTAAPAARLEMLVLAILCLLQQVAGAVFHHKEIDVIFQKYAVRDSRSNACVAGYETNNTAEPDGDGISKGDTKTHRMLIGLQ
jgi:hypothetical protein